MAETLKLNAGSGSLLLQRKPGLEWYECTLLKGGVSVVLGAEQKGYLVRHLRDALSGKPPSPAGKVDGITVQWGLSLAEKHGSLYVRRDDGSLVMMWQDEQGELVHSMKLSPQAVAEWLQQLDTFEQSTD